MKVIKVEYNITDMDKDAIGCNNGNYPWYAVTLENGTVIEGLTCRCGNGCSGTDRLPNIGDEWYEDRMEEVWK
jgi:hypothetical protein